MRAAILAQADTMAPSDSNGPQMDTPMDAPLHTAPKAGPGAAILYPWLAAQLTLGAVGYLAYEYDVTAFLDKLYELAAAIAKAFGQTYTRA
jgi:hypothetical protein